MIHLGRMLQVEPNTHITENIKMTLFTSGDWQVDVSDFNTDRFTTHALFDFMCERFPILKDADVEVNQVDLTNEYGYGSVSYTHLTLPTILLV